MATAAKTMTAEVPITYRIRQWIGRAIPHVILIAFSVLALFPIIMIVINSFKAKKFIFGMPFQVPTPDTFSLIGYQTVLNRANFAQYFANSIIVTVASLLLILL